MIGFPRISEQSNDGGQFARSNRAKNLLYDLVRATDPRFKYKDTQIDRTNRAHALNYQRDEIDDAANYWKSLGRVPEIYPNAPYASLGTRIDDVSRTETARNLLYYARMQRQNPDPPYSNNENPYGQLRATVNNTYASLLENQKTNLDNTAADLAAANYKNYLLEKIFKLRQ